jgi:thiol-disulfide isomerase/thioredoxin
MAIRQIGTENFFVSGNQMNLNLAGNTLVFFKSEQCQGCAAFEPVFNQLSREDQRVTYATVDLSYHRNIVQMSKPTTTTIQKVPHLILYVQGRPHARFSGERNIKGLRDFLAGVMKTIPQYPQHPQHSQPQQNQVSFIAPQNNMYGGQSVTGHQTMAMPDIAPPRQAARMATGGGPSQAHPSMQNQCDPDDEDCMLMPSHIIPHNMPWESDYKRMMGEI